MALDGIPEYFADSGSWAMVMPVAPLMAFNPNVAVGARAGQDDADGPLPLVFRQRAQKIVNRQPQQPSLVRLHEVQRALCRMAR